MSFWGPPQRACLLLHSRHTNTQKQKAHNYTILMYNMSSNDMCFAGLYLLVILIVTAAQSIDRRSIRQSTGNVFTLKASPFDQVHAGSRQYDAWFYEKLRVKRRTFIKLSSMLKRHWPIRRQRNFEYSVDFNLATTLMFLGSSGEFGIVATAMGCSKATAIRCVHRVINILTRMARRKINFKHLSVRDLDEIADAFQKQQGIPGIVGAIDGCLFRIQRPADFEGWYCRKGYPAINMQAVCDSSMKFLSYSMMSGSHNDKQLWSHSTLGVNAQKWIPPGYHFIGDSGYTLHPTLMVPYTDIANVKHNIFNYKLSSTRMKIECAFGILKNRWRILSRTLDMKTIRTTTKVIESCLVLHNLCIELDDKIDIAPYIMEEDEVDDEIMDEVAKSDAIIKRDCLCRLVAYSGALER
jgi:DDE superfamily endonuclease